MLRVRRKAKDGDALSDVLRVIRISAESVGRNSTEPLVASVAQKIRGERLQALLGRLVMLVLPMWLREAMPLSPGRRGPRYRSDRGWCWKSSAPTKQPTLLGSELKSNTRAGQRGFDTGLSKEDGWSYRAGEGGGGDITQACCGFSRL